MPIFIKAPFLKYPYRAMAVYPFIFLREWKDKDDIILVNHELIHHRQQLEMLIVPFYLVYLVHYLIGRIRLQDHDSAYRNIIFEREAYSEELNTDYLNWRRFAAFRKY
jgi:hypothetical protein